MSKKLKATSFRLDPDVKNKIDELQQYYSDTLNIKVSQAEIIKIAINSEYESSNLSNKHR